MRENSMGSRGIRGPEERRHERHYYRAPVTLTWNSPSGAPVSIDGTCLDISKSGMQVEIPKAMEAGTEVIIQIESAGICINGPAIARHCRRYGGWFRVGLELPPEPEEEDESAPATDEILASTS